MSLGFPVVRDWDRSGGRGRVFDLSGLSLEILDASREASPVALPHPGDRVNLVVEVPDLAAAHRRLPPDLAAPEPVETRWGASLFSVRDPDGVAVWFLQWTGERP